MTSSDTPIAELALLAVIVLFFAVMFYGIGSSLKFKIKLALSGFVSLQAIYSKLKSYVQARHVLS